jgi:hypothetical protein
MEVSWIEAAVDLCTSAHNTFNHDYHGEGADARGRHQWCAQVSSALK